MLDGGESVGSVDTAVGLGGRGGFYGEECWVTSSMVDAVEVGGHVGLQLRKEWEQERQSGVAPQTGRYESELAASRDGPHGPVWARGSVPTVGGHVLASGSPDASAWQQGDFRTTCGSRQGDKIDGPPTLACILAGG